MLVGKIICYVVAAVMMIALAYGGWKMTSRNAYESPEYSVLEAEGPLELRRYPDLMLATTSMTDLAGNDGSFGRLFQYIAGRNELKEKVAMTTPVFMSLGSGNQPGKMGFIIPRKIAAGKIPRPASEHVELARRRGGLFAVVRFVGRLDEALLLRQRSILEEWIRGKGYEAQGEPEYAVYDPPWTPGFLRRNEILVRIREE